MQGADLLYETDDDNIPMSFGLVFTQLNWMLKLVWMVEFTNAYSYFCDAKVWPRGFH